MQIPKGAIIDELKAKGEHELAAKAEAELPAVVDHVDHGHLLEKVGIKPDELVGKLGL